GDSEASFVIPLIQTQTAGARTLRARLIGPVGPHGVGWQGETTISIVDKLPAVRLESTSVRENSGTVEIRPIFLGPMLPEVPKIAWRLMSESAVARMHC